MFFMNKKLPQNICKKAFVVRLIALHVALGTFDTKTAIWLSKTELKEKMIYYMTSATDAYRLVSILIIYILKYFLVWLIEVRLNVIYWFWKIDPTAIIFVKRGSSLLLSNQRFVWCYWYKSRLNSWFEWMELSVWWNFENWG